MFFGKQLRKFQDNMRNSGWRIQHISWLPDDKVETYNPKSPVTWFLIIAGLFCFLGSPVLLSQQIFSTGIIISIMIFGLVLLMSSRFAAGYFRYGHFVPVEAVCMDREIREYKDPDSMEAFNNITFWQPRILCAFEFQNKTYKVTPIIVKINAFRKEETAKKFLDKRIDENGKCTLWINPKNPLHTVFHKKPITGPYTV